MPGAAQATPTLLKHTVHCMQDVHSDMEMLHAARGTDKPDQRCEGKRSAAECAAETQRALAEIGARSRNHLFCGSQQRALDSIVSEFEVYVAELNCPGRDTWATCTYIEVLVFLQAHYLPSHRGSFDGNVVPSTLRKAISRLKRAFTMRGRVGAWQELPGGGVFVGNPCEHIDIEDYVTAYGNEADDADVHETSATPLTLEAYEQLMAALDSEINIEWARVVRGHGSAHKVITLQRDAAAFSTLWHSARRAADILQCKWDGIFTAAHEAVAPMWLSEMQRRCQGMEPHERAAGALLVVPSATKTEKRCRAATWELPSSGGGSTDPCCPARQLFFLLAAVWCSGWGTLGTGSVFSGYCGRYPEVIGSSALAARFADATERYDIKPIGDVRGYTMHSFRRGRLQHEAARGKTHVELMRLGGITSVKTLMKYLDKGRHL